MTVPGDDVLASDGGGLNDGALDRPREECGVFGIYAPGEDVSRLTYFGLYALQHRGQESAGIACGDGRRLTIKRDMGLVSQVFDEEALLALHGLLAIGHTRYSTTGSSLRCNAQPVLAHDPLGSFALGHNGNLVNARQLRDRLAEDGVQFESTTDSEVIARLIASAGGPLWGARIARSLPKLMGAYSLVMATPSELFAARDPMGVRPLCLGRLGGRTSDTPAPDGHTPDGHTPDGHTPDGHTPDGHTPDGHTPDGHTPDGYALARHASTGYSPGEDASDGECPVTGWVVASETCALDTIGATFEREIEPGELVRIDASGVASYRFADDRPALCSFEYIYFARPDSVVGGRRVYDVRVELGRALAREHPADADVVIPVPDSAVPAAVGYAAESGIPYGEGLIKNRYIGRTFIAPDQRLRDMGIGLKYNPLPGQLRGKRVVVIEDSIVRGSTSRPIVQLLRKAGAREVHLRISSPPYRYPCHLGMDTGRKSELIAARLSVDGIREHIGADSLGYLSAGGLLCAMGRGKATSCLACLDGDYPLPVQMELDKLALE